MVGKTERPTEEQRKHLDKIASMPCICCQKENIAQPSRTEIHHITDGGYRKHSGGHFSVLPLCSFHHRGVPRDGWTVSKTTYEYGPSLELHKRTFVATYGTERELLARLEAGV